MSVSSAAVVEPQVGEVQTREDTPWVTIVFNDPVNLMSYVTYVFMSYFNYPRARAEQLMREVHEQGRSIVSTGARETMERDVQAMHEFGLWASCRRADEADS